jgi:hypothetical protein
VERTINGFSAIAQRSKCTPHAKQITARVHFEALFAEWLNYRAAGLSPPDGDWSDGDSEKLQAREDELAGLITTTPSVYPWMISMKIEVLEHYLSDLGGGQFVDNRELVMLAGIKADLLRVEFSAPNNG